jgi:hypothetical protein
MVLESGIKMPIDIPDCEFMLEELSTTDFSICKEFQLVDAGCDADGTTVHMLIRPLHNESVALIEAIIVLLMRSLKIEGLHHLHGKLSGVIELDIVRGQFKPPIFLAKYDPTRRVGSELPDWHDPNETS